MALNDFLKLSRDNAVATEASELLAYKNALRSAYELGVRIRAKMRHNFDDSGGAGTINWAALQTLWGIPAGGTNVGATATGAVVFTMIDGSVGAMEGTFQTAAAKDLTERVG